MSNFDHLIPPNVRTMGRYIPGKSLKQAERESGVRAIKLASNENPFGPSPRAIEAIRRAAAETNWYPEVDCTELRDLIAQKHGISSAQVLVTAATSSMLHIVGRTLLGRALNAVTSALSFISYPIVCQAAGATLLKVPMRDHGYDLDGILRAINSDTRVVFFANPNNPTGSFVGAEEVDRFVDRLPPHVLLVLDEAYADFAEDYAAERGTEYSHGLRYIAEGRNVLVTRTFSKAHGLAGVRLGYGLGHPELIDYFGRVKVVFSVSSVAEAAGIAALRDHGHLEKTIRNNREGARYFTEELREIGLKVLPTWANFVYVEVEEDAPDLARRLQLEGIIVRPLANWGAPNAMRVSIGTPDQNRAFVAAMKAAMKKVVGCPTL